MQPSSDNLNFTPNIGLCFRAENLRPLNALSGIPLLRALSFIHYFLNQQDNFFLVFKAEELDAMNSTTQLSVNNFPELAKLYDCKITLHEQIEILEDLEKGLDTKLFESIVIKFRITFLKECLVANQHLTTAILNANNSCSLCKNDLKTFAKDWVHSIYGLIYASESLHAQFNTYGEFYYQNSNSIIGEHNCPVIASLID